MSCYTPTNDKPRGRDRLMPEPRFYIQRRPPPGNPERVIDYPEKGQAYIRDSTRDNQEYVSCDDTDAESILSVLNAQGCDDRSELKELRELADDLRRIEASWDGEQCGNLSAASATLRALLAKLTQRS